MSSDIVGRYMILIFSWGFQQSTLIFIIRVETLVFLRDNLWFSGLGTPNDLEKKRTHEIIPSVASVYVPTNFWLDVFVANPIWY